MKLRPVIKIPGGKYLQTSHIISHFPENYQDLNYYELCGGAASVLLNKKPSEREIYNDLDSHLFNIFYHIRNDPTELISRLNQVQYCEDTFRVALESNPEINSLDNAIREIVLRRMSRGGMKETYCWSERLRGGMPGELNSWRTFLLQLPMIAERLKNVEVMNRDVFELIPELDSEQSLFFLDPPYLHSTRSSTELYDIEMNESDHVRLAEMLVTLKGKVILCGYYSSLYAKLYKGWRMVVKEIANHSSQQKIKQRRLECLWMR